MKRVAQEFVPGAPVYAVSGLTFMGITMQDWVYLVTLCYTLLLIVRIFPKVWGQVRRQKAQEGEANG